MTTYKVITLPLAEEAIADQTDYIAFDLKSFLQVFHTVISVIRKINNIYAGITELSFKTIFEKLQSQYLYLCKHSIQSVEELKDRKEDISIRMDALEEKDTRYTKGDTHIRAPLCC